MHWLVRRAVVCAADKLMTSSTQKLLAGDKGRRKVLANLIHKMAAIDFTGKRALVTGGAQGIGKGLVEALVKCKAQVVALDKDLRSLEQLKVELPEVEIKQVDLTDWDATKKVVESCDPIHLLVNNAGITILESVGQITERALDLILSVNVKATINVSQIVAEGMKARGEGGAIVNLSSQASHIALPSHTSYCASKGAVNLITKVMALELGPHQIRVNAVSPTVVDTPMGRAVWSDPEVVREAKAKIPLGKFCEIKNVVDVVIFLLSEGAAMMTGSIVRVDGGYTVA